MLNIETSAGTFRRRGDLVEFRPHDATRYRAFANTGKAAFIEEAHRVDREIERLRARAAQLTADRDALWYAGADRRYGPPYHRPLSAQEG